MTQHIAKHGDSRKRLLWALALGLIYLLVVAVGSVYSGSLSLLANAGHMLLHNGALIIGIVATSFAMKAPNEKFSSGYNKVEALGGYTNGLILLVVALWVLSQVFGFFDEHGHSTHEINASLAGYIALFGLISHGIAVFILYGGKDENLCVNASFYQISLDVLNSIGILAMGLFVHFTDIHEADLLLAALIGSFILYNAIRIIKKAIVLLLDGTPNHINHSRIVEALKKVKHIKGVHHLVIRYRTSKDLELSAHLVMNQSCIDTEHWETCRKHATALLQEQFNIAHCVLQLESEKDEHEHL